MSDEEKIKEVVTKFQECLSTYETPCKYKSQQRSIFRLIDCTKKKFKCSQVYRIPDDPRIDDYVVSISEDMYILISGTSDYCEKINLYNTPLTQFNLLNKNEFDQFINFRYENDEEGLNHIFTDFVQFTKEYQE
jgi:hypothetical protein